MARSVTNDQGDHCLQLDKLGKAKVRRVLCACMACADQESFVGGGGVFLVDECR